MVIIETSRQQLIDEDTREVVEAHEKARGYEIGKGQYLLIGSERSAMTTRHFTPARASHKHRPASGAVRAQSATLKFTTTLFAV